MTLASVVRRDEDHVLTVGEVSQRNVAALSSARTRRGQHHNGDCNVESDATTRGLHERCLDTRGGLAPDRQTGFGGPQLTPEKPTQIALPPRPRLEVGAGDPVDGVASRHAPTIA